MRRIVAIAGIPILAIALIFVLVYVIGELSWRGGSAPVVSAFDTASAPTSTPPASSAKVASEEATPEETSPEGKTDGANPPASGRIDVGGDRIEGTPDVAGNETIAAVVNGQPVTEALLQDIDLFDITMSSLLGMAAADGSQLEQAINGELVWQAAQAANFQLPPGEAERTLESLLVQSGEDQATLVEMLAQSERSLDDLLAYLHRLLVIDRFAAAQAEVRGTTVPEYLGSLQNAAQISFGVAKSDLPAFLDVSFPAASGATAQTDNGAPNTDEANLMGSDLFADSTIDGAAAPESGALTDSNIDGMANVETVLSPPEGVPLTRWPAYNAGIVDTFAVEDLAGAPAILSFWTTWCPYCHRQTPILVDAYDRIIERGIQLVGISVGEDAAVVEAYVTGNAIPYPIALDKERVIADSYSVRGFPTTYFLDSNGVVIARQVGALTAESLDDYLNQLAPPPTSNRSQELIPGIHLSDPDASNHTRSETAL